MKIPLIVLCVTLSSVSYGQQQETEFVKALRLSCDKHKLALGCYNYANSLQRSGNELDADKYFEISCKLGHSPSCQKEKWDLPEKEKTVSEKELDTEEVPDLNIEMSSGEDINN